jgi:hypothetical protein
MAFTSVDMTADRVLHSGRSCDGSNLDSKNLNQSKCMKTKTTFLAILCAVGGLVAASLIGHAQSKVAGQMEAAIIKWDGNDRVQVMSPTKNEVIRVFQSGGQKVSDIPEEEYCITWVANKMASEGWQLVNLNNRRILLQRPSR